MRWDTENYKQPKQRRISRTSVLALAVLILAIFTVVTLSPFLFSSSGLHPPPVNTKICASPATNCFNDEIDKNSFNGNTNLFWTINDSRIFNLYNISAIPTVKPLAMYLDPGAGQFNIQFKVIGAQVLNLSLIRIFDMNMSTTCNTNINNCSTYVCSGNSVCHVSNENLYFKISIPLRLYDIYQLVFATSGNNSVWQIRFHS